MDRNKFHEPPSKVPRWFAQDLGQTRGRNQTYRDPSAPARCRGVGRTGSRPDLNGHRCRDRHPHHRTGEGNQSGIGNGGCVCHCPSRDRTGAGVGRVALRRDRRGERLGGSLALHVTDGPASAHRHSSRWRQRDGQDHFDRETRPLAQAAGSLGIAGRLRHVPGRRHRTA